MSTPLLELEAACFGHDGRVVVEVPQLVLRRGETTLVTGPNGAGKSTLLRGILGLLPPLRGTRRVADGVRFGYVPQRDAIDPRVPMTARDIVAPGAHARLRPWQRAGDRETRAVDAALAASDALEFARERWGSLSGGQRQRVLIARALATGAGLLVLDEPTSGVDRETEERILDRLDRLRQELRLAVCIVSHHEASLAGRVDQCLQLERERPARLSVTP